MAKEAALPKTSLPKDMTMAKDSGAMPPFGGSLVVLLATAASGLAGFGFLLHGQMAFWGWVTLAATVGVLWLELRALPGFRERSALRRARQEAARLVKAVRSAAKRQKNWISNDAGEELEKLCSNVVAAAVTNDTEQILAQTKKLDDLAEKKLKRKPIAREYVEQIGGALLAAAVLRGFFYEAYRIPSGSMVPTLLVGDHLFVNKFIYGLRVPFTLTKYFIKAPNRGDIVVFDRPGDEGGDDIIKRVIGLPGDRIDVRDRHVSINGKPLETKPLPPVDIDDCDVEGNERGHLCVPGKKDHYERFEEKVGDHWHVTAVMPNRLQLGNAEGTWIVEPGHVFVMGDNRDDSLDSRFGPTDESNGFGQVPLNYIKGRADVIWMSLGGPYGVRFPRMFTLIH